MIDKIILGIVGALFGKNQKFMIRIKGMKFFSNNRVSSPTNLTVYNGPVYMGCEEEENNSKKVDSRNMNNGECDSPPEWENYEF